MKVNREMVIRAGLKLLNQVGLEQLTLRLLGSDLKIQAPTLYWHFKSKEDLIDAMATMVLAEGAGQLVPAKESLDWVAWAASFGTGLRKTLLAYRDGARLVAGTRLTATRYMKTAERIAGKVIESGFTATGIARAQRLDDSFIQIAQACGHVQKDQFGAALSKTSVRILLFCT